MNVSIRVNSPRSHVAPIINIHLPAGGGHREVSASALPLRDSGLVAGDGQDALEALSEISRALEAPNTLEDILFAIDQIKADAARSSGPRFEALDEALNPTAIGTHAYVRDNSTGLIWTAGNVSAERLKWADADQACKALGDGWRLPTRAELLTLVDDTKHDPCIDTQFFPNTKPNWYWTATPAAWSAECAWVVHFGGGDAGDDVRAFDAFVRAVRSPGQ